MQGVAVAEARLPEGARPMPTSAGRARRQAITGEGMAPIVHHPDVQRMLLTMQALTGCRARHQLFLRPCHRHGARLGRRRHGPLAGARQPADAGRQGVLHRCRRRGRLARRPGAWRHGLHRGDRRGRASTATPASRRSTKAPTASRRSTSSPASCRSRAASMSTATSPSLPQAVRAVRAANRAGFGSTRRTPRLGRWPTCRRRRATCRRCSPKAAADEALAGATPYLRLFALAAGGAYLAQGALADGSDRAHRALPVLRRKPGRRDRALDASGSSAAPTACRGGRRADRLNSLTGGPHDRPYPRRAPRRGPDHPHEPPGQEERPHPRHVRARWPPRSPTATPTRRSASMSSSACPAPSRPATTSPISWPSRWAARAAARSGTSWPRSPRAAKPIVSGVDGIAVGIGTTLNLHCDLTFATPRTVFRTPFVDLGLVPEAGSSLLAPGVLGRQAAFALLGARRGLFRRSGRRTPG